MSSHLPNSIRIVEVGPRDGLQSLPNIIATEDKVKYIDLLSAAGLPEIEVSSFVSPKWVPQLSDAVEVFHSISKRRLTVYTALVPNVKGLEAAITAGFRSVAIFVTASETFSQKNTNCSIDESFARLSEMYPIWKEEDLRVRAYVSTCWHCPFEGKIAPMRVASVVDRLYGLGIDEISLGDTIGKAQPDEVKLLMRELLSQHPVEDFALHFHDTFGHALDNIRAGLELGVRTFDSSAGGVGGCPFAPGATGNVSTEAVVQLCESLGVKTHIKLDALQEAGRFIQQVIQRTNG